MDVWMYGRMNGWVAGWVAGWMDVGWLGGLSKAGGEGEQEVYGCLVVREHIRTPHSGAPLGVTAQSIPSTQNSESKGERRQEGTQNSESKGERRQEGTSVKTSNKHSVPAGGRGGATDAPERQGRTLKYKSWVREEELTRGGTLGGATRPHHTLCLFHTLTDSIVGELPICGTFLTSSSLTGPTNLRTMSGYLRARTRYHTCG
eukprot:356484-Chlamydomonas_euryale.AAC.3